ncbi:phosphoprotein phosphatase 1 family protein, partial [Ostertagia ostertagi]
MEESNLCECEVPIKVIGDIHAQYQDMNRLFDLIGRVPQEKLLFLGDYVDRGPQGVEVIILLFALKLRYRDRIFLLRGNHETPAVNKIYGFYNECVMKYGAGICMLQQNTSRWTYLKKVLCMHGGLSPELNHLDVIRNIPRPCEPLDRGLLIDLTWADPTNKGWMGSTRESDHVERVASCSRLVKMLGLNSVVQDGGYEMMAGRRLITVFSAPNYCGQFTNAAAIITFQQLKMQIAPNLAPKARPCPVIASDPNAVNAKADKDFIKPFTGFKAKQQKPPEEDKSQLSAPMTNPTQPAAAPQASTTGSEKDQPSEKLATGTNGQPGGTNPQPGGQPGQPGTS